MKADADILKEARSRFRDAYEADEPNRIADIEDRQFLAGEQYPPEVREARANRPCEVFNRLPQFVKQVTGEMRQNKPAIKVLPVDDKTDPELAKVYSAIIRHIESKSGANRVYVRAGESAVQGGIGWFRITAVYADEGSFDQELRIEAIRNALCVTDDPDAVGLLREDANFRFIHEQVKVSDFKRRFPKADVSSFEDMNTTETELQQWNRTGGMVRLAEYWRRVPSYKTLARMQGGAIYDVTGVEGVGPGAVVQADGMDEPMLVQEVRKVDCKKVEWFLLNGAEILARGEWKGSFIPIIPVIGEEITIGDRTIRHGIVRFAKGAQRSYNYFRNAGAEFAAMQPKAPFIATAKQVGPYKKMWDNLNTSNLPYLLYEPDPLVAGAPQRSMPPLGATSFHQEAQIADADMKAITGIYDASLGNKSNETSGVAIRARQAQGNTVTFVYLDNMVAAIRMAGRILVELIPHYYDGECVIRMIGEDDSIEGYVAINKILPDGRLWNDISQGTYDVEVTTGPAFATKREEAADRLLGLVQAVPGLAQVAGDIIAKSIDVPYADEISERLARMLPAGLDPKLDAKRQEEAQKQPQQQPDPQQQAAQMMQMQAAELELKLKFEQSRKAEADADKAEAEAVKAQAEAGVKSFEAGAMLGAVSADFQQPAGMGQPGAETGF